MGQIFSRRRQKSTVEILEEIDKETDELENHHADKEYNRRRSIGYLILVSILIFVGFAVFAYMYFYPEQGLIWRDYLIVLPVIVVYPFLVWGLKWTLCLWYDQSLSTDERKLNRLRKKKREILDTVKDKETYKVAKEILERFDPQVRQEKTAKKAREFQQQLAMIRKFASLEGNALTNPSPAGSSSQIRNRRPANQRPKSRSPSPTLNRHNESLPRLGAPEDAVQLIHPPPPQPPIPVQIYTPARGPSVPTMMRPMGPIVGGAGYRTPMMPPRLGNQQFTPAAGGSEMPMALQTPMRLPRPIIPRDRSVWDKMIDYLLGEGPSSRYALVCQQCHSHNGMALKEELETMAFRCCYCFAFNPARKLAQPPSSLATSDQLTGDATHQPSASASRTDGDQSNPSTAPPSPKHRTDGFSGSRAPSRSSLASLDSTQSAPPFYMPSTHDSENVPLPPEPEQDEPNEESDHPEQNQGDIETIPTSTATVTSTDSEPMAAECNNVLKEKD